MDDFYMIYRTKYRNRRLETGFLYEKSYKKGFFGQPKPGSILYLNSSGEERPDDPALRGIVRGCLIRNITTNCPGGCKGFLPGCVELG